MTLYLGVSNIGSPSGQMTLFTGGAAFNANSSIPLFLNNSGNIANIPLFVKGLSYGTNPFVNSDGYYPIENSMTLFMQIAEGASIPLYIGSNSSGNVNIPIYLRCENQMSGQLPLFIPSHVSINQNIPLYHHGF